MPSKKKTKHTKNPGAITSTEDFNVLQTFYKAAPNEMGFDYLQVIDGKPVQGWTRKEFQQELILLALDL